MRYITTVLLLALLVLMLGKPHAKTDEHSIVKVSGTASALSSPKPTTTPTPVATPVVAPEPTPVVCPETQWVWADDGKCHDKPVAPIAPAQSALAVAPTANAVAGCGDNEYANYIYMHESGCNTNALNSIGCYGIGQSCPKSKIAHCGSDYACQNEWFTNYAVERYGSWAGAYNFWVSHKWW